MQFKCLDQHQKNYFHRLYLFLHGVRNQNLFPHTIREKLWSDFSFVAVLGMAIAVVSLGIMLAVSKKQGEQTEDLQKQGEIIDKTTAEIHKTTAEIKKISKEQLRLLTGVKDVYATAYVEYVQSISKSYEHELDLYRSYTSYNTTINTRKETDRANIITNYNSLLHVRMPKLDFMELVRTFGRQLANKWWRNTPKLFAEDWQPHDDYGMALLIYSYKESMFNLVLLKDDFLEFCVPETITHDENYHPYYDMIKKVWKEAKTPQKGEFDDTFSSIN